MPILDTDIYSHEALAPGTKATKEVIKRYGNKICQTTKGELSINRQLLGDIIFSNQNEKVWLENLLHPIIKNRLNEELNNAKNIKIIGLIIPLLFEAELAYLCSEVWLIDCRIDQQYERLMYRDKLNLQQAKCRMKSQIPIAMKREFADEIIDNSKETDFLEEQINKLL